MTDDTRSAPEPPTADGVPAVGERESDGEIRHRVVQDDLSMAALVPPNGLVPRATVRMARPNLAQASASSSSSPAQGAGALPRTTVAMVRPSFAPSGGSPSPAAAHEPLVPVRVEPGAPSAVGAPSYVAPGAPSSYGPPPVSQVATAPREPPGASTALVARAREPRHLSSATPVPPSHPTFGRGAPSAPVDPRLVLLAEPDSARAVAFRVLRDNLLAKGLPRVVAVASPAPRDGGTTCAVNLALALAEHASSRVLLVDGNFLTPALARIFAVEPDPARPAELSWLGPLKLAVLMPRFHVAALVRRPGEAMPRFDKPRFQGVVDRLGAGGYDHVVIDAPAFQAAPMASQLVAVADAVLLAVRAGRTTARALRRAADLIPSGKAIGVALMDGDPEEA